MSRLASAAAAIACGAAAGCLYLAVLLGTPGALILVFMTQLPLFIAGLWLGAGAAALAGLTGMLILLAAGDLLGAAVFAGLYAGPVVLLVRQALLARQRGDGALAWYPLGSLTAWLTALALAGIAAAVLLVGGPQGLQSALQSVVGEVLDHLVRRPLPNRDQVAETIAMVIPGTVAATWMMMVVANATLAQGVLARFGVSWRPSPDLAGLGLPLWLPVAFGLAVMASALGGGARLAVVFYGIPLWSATIALGRGLLFIGVNVMITLFVPFCLAGLAVLHVAARRLSSPVMALVGFYTLAGLFAWPFLAAAILGLLESGFGLRHRLLPRGASIDG